MPLNTNYCFTLNNYTAEDERALRTLSDSSVRYLVVGKEVGETNGVPHFQGFIVFTKRCGVGEVRKRFEQWLGHARSHIEIARGTSEANYEYCTKQGDFWEIGERPSRAKEANKTNSEKCREVLDLAKKRKLGEIEDKYPDLSLRYRQSIKEVMFESLNTNKVLDKLENEIYTGPSGSGKTKQAMSQSPYIKDIRSKWWDSYQGEEVVLLDDITLKWMEDNYHLLLQWCDHYPFKAEVKGAMVQIRPKKFILTSNFEWDTLLSVVPFENREALARRIKEVKFPLPTLPPPTPVIETTQPGLTELWDSGGGYVIEISDDE